MKPGNRCDQCKSPAQKNKCNSSAIKFNPIPAK